MLTVTGRHPKECASMAKNGGLRETRDAEVADGIGWDWYGLVQFDVDDLVISFTRILHETC